MRSLHLSLLLIVLVPSLASAQAQPAPPVTVTVAADPKAADLPPRFLGLSYESSQLLPQGEHYYFDAGDDALINMFKTLGIRSLRVGANAVDDPRIPYCDLPMRIDLAKVMTGIPA